MSDFTKNSEKLIPDGPTQVIVIKRYDDEGGIYTGIVTHWPAIEDDMGWETTYIIGFLDDHIKFGNDLESFGYAIKDWGDIPEDFQSFLTYNNMPIEWHKRMEELGDRVTIYSNQEEIEEKSISTLCKTDSHRGCWAQYCGCECHNNNEGES